MLARRDRFDCPRRENSFGGAALETKEESSTRFLEASTVGPRRSAGFLLGLRKEILS